MSSRKRTTFARTGLRKKGIADSRLNSVEKKLAARKIKQTKARLAKLRSIMVPGRFDIRCELDKFYEEVNAMHQQFGQHNTFGLGGGRRKRRSSKLKRRPRRSSKLKRRSRRSSKLKRRNN